MRALNTFFGEVCDAGGRTAKTDALIEIILWPFNAVTVEALQKGRMLSHREVKRMLKREARNEQKQLRREAAEFTRHRPRGGTVMVLRML